MSFIIDTIGSTDNNESSKNIFTAPNPSSSKINQEKDESPHPLAHLFDDPEEPELSPIKKKQNAPLSEKLYEGLTGKTKQKLLPVLDHRKKKSDIEELLKKSVVLNQEFENQHSIGDLNISDKKLREQRKKEREKTKGTKWFGLPATEMTDEIKRDLEILQMRSVLDPKRFYKKNDNKVLPKYFQIGKVMDSPLDYYNNRLTKKEQKKTLVDELMADAQFSKYRKTKYAEIITEKQKTHYKAWRQAKKLKKKK
ncbi:hypothetical protein HHI36_017841 [Cryptolaemus montrouzieri]|uniref:Fcf2 pre-rRNA processing C-terminal domain-containing protein n=1 Tax=Cryptolaemus montrouzieri TaxID=559131 RepID=A0ABD2NPC8_9CUCU